jgi:hypothetical protein
MKNLVKKLAKMLVAFKDRKKVKAGRVSMVKNIKNLSTNLKR